MWKLTVTIEYRLTHKRQRQPWFYFFLLSKCWQHNLTISSDWKMFQPGWAKKWSHKRMAKILSNLKSWFFTWSFLGKFAVKCSLKIPPLTTPCMCCHTTVWKNLCQKTSKKVVVACTFCTWPPHCWQTKKVHETTTFLLATRPNIHRF